MKTQKTILYIPHCDPNNDCYIVPQPGDKAILVEYYDNDTKKSKWDLCFDLDGVSGSLIPTIKRYHGRRGTTDGVTKYAYGLRKIRKVEKIDDFNYKVVVGPDLHPELR